MISQFAKNVLTSKKFSFIGDFPTDKLYLDLQTGKTIGDKNNMNNYGRLQNIFWVIDRLGLLALHTGEQKFDLGPKSKKAKLTECIF